MEEAREYLAALPRFLTNCRSFLAKTGPGLITGAADDDPSGISTYAIAGATARYSMLWLAPLTTVMMIVVQGMCARIGLVTGMGLAEALRKNFPFPLAAALGIMTIGANTLNLGADLAGMAASIRLLVGGPPLLWVVVFGVACYVAPVYLNYRTFVNVVKVLALSLGAYVVAMFAIHPPWLEVLASTLIPRVHLDRTWLTTVVAVLGTTITPYLFYWQASLMVEEDKAQGKVTLTQRRGATKKEVADANADVTLGMIVSNAIMFCIIVTTATTLSRTGHASIQSAQDAAEALRPLAGDFAYVLFAAGMVGTGLLAIPTLAGSSAFVFAETFKVRGASLAATPDRAPRFYGVFGAGIAIGIAFNVFHVDPIGALFWSAVVNGVAAVPLLVVITLLANRRSLMQRWTNSRAANVWAILTIVLMAGAAIGMFF
ncbi:MAG: divalent metal cation transporter [Candidatus Eremiobacteraeota bacterium]|nr:divalent metal cation transporter [Candidatus Eremiobacteraeota bacterium]